ncbi:MAG: 4-(cytidine 5'-diphospho)-2-C-methyl-D-erythritol kinase [bacterium]|jgi:4-diphosphocytidyl-2-C-methyl-D-erythritol kinase|nr:4-(cytidine 5'-diphospho)-2-C-methyl-D-erythritol kinase [bacterium]
MKIKAYAKINLMLQILSKRVDGYHDLASVMQEIALCDLLTITKVPAGITLTCSDRSLPVDSNNLVYKAAVAMHREAERLKKPVSGLKIRIQKNIPVGAGLGGGSSDAAATLKALNKLWRLRLNEARLARIGAELGSDVPFFISGGTALAQGRGERLTIWPKIPSFRVVLVKPFIGISTAWAYKNLKINLTKQPKSIKIIHNSLRKKCFDQLKEYLQNDLESVCISKYPLILEIKHRLLVSGAAAALMSGSGSTVFGLVTSRTAENRIKEVFSRAKGFWVWSGSTLVRRRGQRVF